MTTKRKARANAVWCDDNPDEHGWIVDVVEAGGEYYTLAPCPAHYHAARDKDADVIARDTLAYEGMEYVGPIECTA